MSSLRTFTMPEVTMIFTGGHAPDIIGQPGAVH